jgi:hypothetical protein
MRSECRDRSAEGDCKQAENNQYFRERQAAMTVKTTHFLMRKMNTAATVERLCKSDAPLWGDACKHTPKGVLKPWSGRQAGEKMPLMVEQRLCGFGLPTANHLSDKNQMIPTRILIPIDTFKYRCTAFKEGGL